MKTFVKVQINESSSTYNLYCFNIDSNSGAIILTFLEKELVEIGIEKLAFEGNQILLCFL